MCIRDRDAITLTTFTNDGESIMVAQTNDDPDSVTIIDSIPGTWTEVQQDLVDSDQDETADAYDTEFNVNADTAASLETGETVDAGDANIIIFDEADVSLNFALVDGAPFTNVDSMDLTGTGGNEVALELGDLIDLTDGSNTLVINGDALDSVTLAGDDGIDNNGNIVEGLAPEDRFITTEQQTINDVVYDVYALDDATVLVETEVTVTV